MIRIEKDMYILNYNTWQLLINLEKNAEGFEILKYEEKKVTKNITGDVKNHIKKFFLKIFGDILKNVSKNQKNDEYYENFMKNEDLIKLVDKIIDNLNNEYDNSLITNTTFVTHSKTIKSRIIEHQLYLEI